MSLKSWMKKFYAVPAELATDSDKKALEHSIRKWTGLLPENLKKHGVYLQARIVKEIGSTPGGESLYINSDTCALCIKYLVTSPKFNDSCDGCPLYEQLGFKQCDRFGQPFRHFHNYDDPVPMIEALKAALERVSTKAEHTKQDPTGHSHQPTS